MNVLVETLPGPVYRLAPQGRLDAVTVPALETAIDEQLAALHYRLIIDLAEVGYMSSSGLRALLRARRQAQLNGGDVVLCAMNERVTEVFEMIGFNNLFKIYATPAEAAVALTKNVTAQH